MFKRIQGILLVCVVVMLFGCYNSEEGYREERVKNSKKHYEEINKKVIPEGKIFTLPECIKLALEQNLDLKVFELREAVNRERKTAAMLGMLPELNVSMDATHRTNEPGSSSENIKTGAQTFAPSKSSEEDEVNFKIEMALSTLDFGLAYFNSSQAHDRGILAKQQTRRAAQNLKLDVVKTYLKVAAAQDAIETTEALIKKCHNIQDTITELSKAKRIDPMRLLDERKRFIRLEKRLMTYRRSYNNACIELRALMGYLPINSIRVSTKALKEITVVDLPSIETLEKIALVERPELYQLDVQVNITVTEARKTILMMFPNVRIFADFNNSSNKFLYHQSWWEIGIRAAYNLLKLPQQVAKYYAIETEADELAMRTLALSIGVMSQVRIAQANLDDVKERYDLDNRVYQAYSEHLKVALQNYESGGALSKLEISRLELETAETEIDRLLALSNYYLSYYRMLNTVGVTSLDKETVKTILAEIDRSDRVIAEKNEEMAKARKALKDTSDSFNGVDIKDNTISLTERTRLDELLADAK
jgi:outer membrane protein